MAFRLYIAKGSSNDCEHCGQPAGDREMIILQVTTRTNGGPTEISRHTKTIYLHLACFEAQFVQAKYQNIFFPEPLPD